MFTDRRQAGWQLAERLTGLEGQHPVILGLPRGGVPVAFEVAQALNAPLDVIVVRKLGVPGQPELAMGAVGEGGVVVLNPDVIRVAQVSDTELDAAQRAETAQVLRRAQQFRAGRAPLSLRGRTAIIVDDGVATGSTATAACQVAHAMGAQRVVVAVPVATAEAAWRLRAAADEVICLHQPPQLCSVGQWYEDFRQVSDEEVIELLSRSAPIPSPAPVHASEVRVDAGEVGLIGDVTVPAGASGLVIFVHGSGSSRHSPRNVYVAHVLNAAGIGTLLFDLLTEDEDADRTNVFDIELLAGRLRAATAWVRRQKWSAGMQIGWFGASTGGAAALWAAAEPHADVAAIVSRGGRPDLAGERLDDVRVPTLLIVGGDDDVVLRLNHAAAARLRCPHEISVVPGATHLFEEPGTLASMAILARDWLARHLQPHAAFTPART